MGDIPQDEVKYSAKLAFQSKELEELLDVIDDLRLQGITGYIDLPQLIVCGDQSSGKSSVLEALSGVQFPMKDNLCTRHPTEVILRRKRNVSTAITIVPDPNRSADEKRKLQEFKAGDEALKDFSATVEAAGKAMGLEDNTRAFSTDVLRVELTGPTLPHLTLVDLPGLFHSGSKAQSDTDAQVVKDLVTRYMEKQRSIILAVVSAKNDYANQVVTKHARDVDPLGERTLGIITKPDLLDEGSSSEAQYLEMARNKDVVLRLGWHVLKNRDYKTRNCTIEERNKAEASFFAKGIWTNLSPSQVGIESLKSRLSRVLKDHILAELPSLTKDVELGIADCRARLDRLGSSRVTLQEQRRYLHQISQEFHSIIQNGVAGYYNERFFDESSSESYPKRIRAVVANLLEEFATRMRENGKQYLVVQDTAASNGPRRNDGGTSQEARLDKKYPIKVTKEVRLQRVMDLMKETRGRELPGFPRFETVTTLFKEQCEPWQKWVDLYTNAIFDAVCNALHLALDHVCDQVTKEGVLRLIVNPALERRKRELGLRVTQNLKQHIYGHPVTFNHYFTENVQKLRHEHHNLFLEPKLRQYLRLGNHGRSVAVDRQITIEGLLQVMTNNTEADMIKFACSEALHFMEAYYKVALKFFVDDFSIHTIEHGLLDDLEAIFNPSTVLSLDDQETEDIAGEIEESKVERASSSTKLAALENALKILQQLDRSRLRK